MVESGKGKVRLLGFLGVFAGLGLLGIYLKRRFWDNKNVNGKPKDTLGNQDEACKQLLQSTYIHALPNADRENISRTRPPDDAAKISHGTTIKDTKEVAEAVLEEKFTQNPNYARDTATTFDENSNQHNNTQPHTQEESHSVFDQTISQTTSQSVTSKCFEKPQPYPDLVTCSLVVIDNQTNVPTSSNNPDIDLCTSDSSEETESLPYDISFSSNPSQEIAHKYSDVHITESVVCSTIFPDVSFPEQTVNITCEIASPSDIVTNVSDDSAVFCSSLPSDFSPKVEIESSACLNNPSTVLQHVPPRSTSSPLPTLTPPPSSPHRRPKREKQTYSADSTTSIIVHKQQSADAWLSQSTPLCWQDSWERPAHDVVVSSRKERSQWSPAKLLDSFTSTLAESAWSPSLESLQSMSGFSPGSTQDFSPGTSPSSFGFEDSFRLPRPGSASSSPTSNSSRSPFIPTAHKHGRQPDKRGTQNKKQEEEEKEDVIPDSIIERAPLLEEEDDDDDSHKEKSLQTDADDTVKAVTKPTPACRELTPPKVTDQELAAALDHTQAEGGKMSIQCAKTLVSVLGTTDYDLLQKVLITIANAAAFTTSQECLREAGALGRLTRLLSAHTMAVRLNGSVHPAIVNGVNTAISNLAMNSSNQEQLKECIMSLIELSRVESVQLSSLQALTNLSVSPSLHPPYTQLIQQLYAMLDLSSVSVAVKVQALRVLVNLSCNPDMVPHLMAAKAPSCALDLLSPTTPEDVLLRWLTVLANTMWTARDHGITYASLPTDHKAASPETMYTALYGLHGVARLKSKVFVLSSKQTNSDIRYQATRVYTALA